MGLPNGAKTGQNGMPLLINGIQSSIFAETNQSEGLRRGTFEVAVRRNVSKSDQSLLVFSNT